MRVQPNKPFCVYCTIPNTLSSTLFPFTQKSQVPFSVHWNIPNTLHEWFMRVCRRRIQLSQWSNECSHSATTMRRAMSVIECAQELEKTKQNNRVNYQVITHSKKEKMTNPKMKNKQYGQKENDKCIERRNLRAPPLRKADFRKNNDF